MRVQFIFCVLQSVLKNDQIFVETSYPLIRSHGHVNNYVVFCFWQINTTLCQSQIGSTRWSSWLRHCATNRKVSGSIPDGVIGIFQWHNSSGRTMALGLTQPLTGVTGIFPGWQPYHLNMPTVLKSGRLNLLDPSEPVQDSNGIVLTFYQF